MYLVKVLRLFNDECPGVGHAGRRLKHWGLTPGQRSSESISSVLSSSKSWRIFRVLSAASHAYSEHESSGGYSWGNNALAWGGVKVSVQTERTRLWYEPQKVLHSSSRNVSISSNSSKPHGCNNHTEITWLCQKLINHFTITMAWFQVYTRLFIFPGPSCSHLCSCRLHLPFKCLNPDTSAAPAVAIYFENHTSCANTLSWFMLIFQYCMFVKNTAATSNGWTGERWCSISISFTHW